MKKIVAVIAVVAFMGAIAVPALASTDQVIAKITLNDDDPKKAEKKTEKKSHDCTTETKATKAEAKSEKAHDCDAEKPMKKEAKAESKSEGCGK